MSAPQCHTLCTFLEKQVLFNLQFEGKATGLQFKTTTTLYLSLKVLRHLFSEGFLSNLTIPVCGRLAAVAIPQCDPAISAARNKLHILILQKIATSSAEMTASIFSWVFSPAVNGMK